MNTGCLRDFLASKTCPFLTLILSPVSRLHTIPRGKRRDDKCSKVDNIRGQKISRASGIKQKN